MSIEKTVFSQINKSYQGFKMLDAFSFDNNVKNFWNNNLRIENIAQLHELIKLIKSCKQYNLVAFEEILSHLENELIFYKKTLAVFYKNPQDMSEFIEENFYKLFVVSYQENKDYIITSEDNISLLIKKVIENEEKYNIEQKSELLTKLLNYINQNKQKTKLQSDLMSNQQTIIALIEILKII
ncbi:hypothetical protein MENTO_v1c06740 [Mesoplasma entomophilum]|uniref:Uncharacterized protein n=1 Tax=Mesoplasma entomophilum TaxID=2149 RepID=A0A3S5XZV3_9MOLU|nr:hypothetical protein [Mesoplasma entomophilum]ATQ35804.1 hypothetical protein CS528_03520 [Mesoplasma entomophilum]ATZ19775.1 hypothetical protein MENTO_v1c06740 [Mesoplasma entomophilum]